MTTALRLGTRRSPLALAQSGAVAAALTAASGIAVELVEITTKGDVSRESLSQLGGTGVFVSALRDALLAGSVDLAVHSLKDLPTAHAPGLVIGAVPGREDPRDVLVGERRPHPARPLHRCPHRHRFAAPGGPAPRPRLRPRGRRRPRQRRHPDLAGAAR